MLEFVLGLFLIFVSNAKPDGNLTVPSAVLPSSQEDVKAIDTDQHVLHNDTQSQTDETGGTDNESETQDEANVAGIMDEGSEKTETLGEANVAGQTEKSIQESETQSQANVAVGTDNGTESATKLVIVQSTQSTPELSISDLYSSEGSLEALKPSYRAIKNEPKSTSMTNEQSGLNNVDTNQTSCGESCISFARDVSTTEFSISTDEKYLTVDISPLESISSRNSDKLIEASPSSSFQTSTTNTPLYSSDESIKSLNASTNETREIRKSLIEITPILQPPDLPISPSPLLKTISEATHKTNVFPSYNIPKLDIAILSDVSTFEDTTISRKYNMDMYSEEYSILPSSSVHLLSSSLMDYETTDVGENSILPDIVLYPGYSALKENGILSSSIMFLGSTTLGGNNISSNFMTPSETADLSGYVTHTKTVDLLENNILSSSITSDKTSTLEVPEYTSMSSSIKLSVMDKLGEFSVSTTLIMLPENAHLGIDTMFSSFMIFEESEGFKWTNSMTPSSTPVPEHSTSKIFYGQMASSDFTVHGLTPYNFTVDGYYDVTDSISLYEPTKKEDFDNLSTFKSSGITVDTKSDILPSSVISNYTTAIQDYDNILNVISSDRILDELALSIISNSTEEFEAINIKSSSKTQYMYNQITIRDHGILSSSTGLHISSTFRSTIAYVSPNASIESDILPISKKELISSERVVLDTHQISALRKYMTTWSTDTAIYPVTISDAVLTEITKKSLDFIKGEDTSQDISVDVTKHVVDGAEATHVLDGEDTTHVIRKEETTYVNSGDDTTQEIQGEETTHVLSGEETTHVISVEETTHVMNREETTHVISVEETTHVMNREETTHVISGEETTHVMNREEMTHVISGEETTHVISGEETTHVISGEETTHVISGEETTHVISGEETTHGISGEETTHVIIGEETTHVISGEETTHVINGKVAPHVFSGEDVRFNVTLDANHKKKIIIVVNFTLPVHHSCREIILLVPQFKTDPEQITCNGFEVEKDIVIKKLESGKCYDFGIFIETVTNKTIGPFNYTDCTRPYKPNDQSRITSRTSSSLVLDIMHPAEGACDSFDIEYDVNNRAETKTMFSSLSNSTIIYLSPFEPGTCTDIRIYTVSNKQRSKHPLKFNKECVRPNAPGNKTRITQRTDQSLTIEIQHPDQGEFGSFEIEYIQNGRSSGINQSKSNQNSTEVVISGLTPGTCVNINVFTVSNGQKSSPVTFENECMLPNAPGSRTRITQRTDQSLTIEIQHPDQGEFGSFEIEYIQNRINTATDQNKSNQNSTEVVISRLSPGTCVKINVFTVSNGQKSSSPVSFVNECLYPSTSGGYSYVKSKNTTALTLFVRHPNIGSFDSFKVDYTVDAEIRSIKVNKSVNSYYWTELELFPFEPGTCTNISTYSLSNQLQSQRPINLIKECLKPITPDSRVINRTSASLTISIQHPDKGKFDSFYVKYAKNELSKAADSDTPHQNTTMIDLSPLIPGSCIDIRVYTVSNGENSDPFDSRECLLPSTAGKLRWFQYSDLNRYFYITWFPSVGEVDQYNIQVDCHVSNNISYKLTKKPIYASVWVYQVKPGDCCAVNVTSESHGYYSSPQIYYVSMNKSEPDQVRELTSSGGKTRVQIEWKPPQNTNGWLQGYRVIQYNSRMVKTSMFLIECEETEIGCSEQFSNQIWQCQKYRLSNKTNSISFSQELTTLKVTMQNLQPGTHLNFSVESFNEVGTSEEEFVSVSTIEDVPSAPTDLRIRVLNTSSLEVNWFPPTHPNGKILYYSVTYNTTNEMPKTITLIENQTVLSDLECWEKYYICVFAETYAGFGPQICTTAFTNAYEPASKIESTTASSSTITLKFETPCENKQVDVDISYDVSYTYLNQTCNEDNATNVTLYHECFYDDVCVIEHLFSFWDFFIRVQEIVGNRTGPLSEVQHIRTDPYYPMKVRDLHVSKYTPENLTIEWNEPCHMNGILIGYEVFIEGELWENLNETSVTITDLSPYTSYDITVITQNTYNRSKKVTIQGMTDIAVPTRPVIDSLQPSATSVIVKWSVLDPYPGPTTYTVELIDVENRVVSHTCIGPDYNQTSCSVNGLEEFWSYEVTVTAHTVKGDNKSVSNGVKTLEAAPGPVTNYSVEAETNPDNPRQIYVRFSTPEIRHRNGNIMAYYVKCTSVRTGEIITTMRLEDVKSELKIVVPEQVPLNISVFAETVGNGTEVYKIVIVPKGAEAFPMIQAVAGSVSAVFVFAIFGLIMAVLYKKQLFMFKQQTREKEVMQLKPVVNKQAKKNLLIESEDKRKSRPIKIDRFYQHVEILARDCNHFFSKEYKELKSMAPTFSTDAAEQQEARTKNRYSNILPFDHSRVKLLPLDDDEGSDYINANYIPGFNSKREYIAAQGPLPSTKDDFWRMIWEQNVSVIVMLTQCIERGKRKCETYWPECLKEPVFHGDLAVELENESHLPEYILRTFSITLGHRKRKVRHIHFLKWPDFGCPETTWLLIDFVRSVQVFTPHINPGPIVVHCSLKKQVMHFLYLAWPDMGVPSSTDNMISLVKTVKSHVDPTRKGPITVHCSAGVGRTGTFIVVDILLNQLDADCPQVDIFGEVLKLRNHRCNMVQTEDQYVFIHHCINDYILALLDDSDEEEAYDGGEEPMYQNVPRGENKL